jgi:hypothetical protein
MWRTRRLNDMDPSPWSATPRELTWRDTCAAGDSRSWARPCQDDLSDRVLKEPAVVFEFEGYSTLRKVHVW